MARSITYDVCLKCRKALKWDNRDKENRWLLTIKPHNKGRCEMCGYNGNLYKAVWTEGGVFGECFKGLPGTDDTKQMTFAQFFDMMCLRWLAKVKRTL